MQGALARMLAGRAKWIDGMDGAEGIGRCSGWLDGGFKGEWVAAGGWAARIPKKMVAAADTEWMGHNPRF